VTGLSASGLSEKRRAHRAAAMETRRPERLHVARAATNKFRDAEARAIIGYRAPSPRPFSLSLSSWRFYPSRISPRHATRLEDERRRARVRVGFRLSLASRFSPRGELSGVEFGQDTITRLSAESLSL